MTSLLAQTRARIVRGRRPAVPRVPRGDGRNYISQKTFLRDPASRRIAGGLGMALLARPLLRSAALLGGRWLEPRAWSGLPALQPVRGRTRGNEYQPSNIKRKHKHGWVRRLSTPGGVQVVLRRMLKGRRSLSH